MAKSESIAVAIAISIAMFIGSLWSLWRLCCLWPLWEFWGFYIKTIISWSDYNWFINGNYFSWLFVRWCWDVMICGVLWLRTILRLRMILGLWTILGMWTMLGLVRLGLLTVVRLRWWIVSLGCWIVWPGWIKWCWPWAVHSMGWLISCKSQTKIAELEFSWNDYDIY